MPPINLLIKPASSACNMDCKYCFYKDISKNRINEFEGILNLEKLEEMVKKVFNYADDFCGFTFQGGEPTLVSLNFYKDLINLQKKYNSKNIKVYNSIQTNGINLNEEWAEFLSKNEFLVGLSLDGYSEVHNSNRCFNDGKGSFNKVMQSAALLKKYNVEFNILSVVTKQNSKYINKIYNFYKKNNFNWLQFIPVLDPINDDLDNVYHLDNEAYGEFLIKLFDLWYKDLLNGRYISIRQFDNWLYMLMGEEPEICSMRGQCALQYVIEGNNDVYPCDFYVLDQWKLGNIEENTLDEITNNPKVKEFIEKSKKIPDKCKNCKYYYLCRNGCRRERKIDENKNIDLNKYCTSYIKFFDTKLIELKKALQIILNMKYKKG